MSYPKYEDSLVQKVQELDYFEYHLLVFFKGTQI